MSRPPSPLDRVQKLVLYGVGLINGSLGLALKAEGFSGQVWGWGRREVSLRTAQERGAVDVWTLNPTEALADADLLVLGAPVDRLVELARERSLPLSNGTVVTDVGSTKAEIVRAWERWRPRVRFVGGHPIAGSHRAGVEAARADLFCGATVVLTPTGRTSQEALELVRDLWKRVGACPVELSPEAHDLLLAASSHLPHVVAAALVHTAAGTAREGRSALELVGGGFRDATRIAQGSAELWTAILRQNRVALLEAMEAFLAALEAFRRAMESEDPSDLKKWLDTAAQLRSQLKPDHSKDEHGSRDSS